MIYVVRDVPDGRVIGDWTVTVITGVMFRPYNYSGDCLGILPLIW